jgi:hypothetical protein
MISAIAGLVVAVMAFGIALYKGRTGWHWFLLTLSAFAALWGMSAFGLYLAGVHQSLASADKHLGSFVGALTAAVIVAVLIAVPYRPRRHSVSFEAPPRRPAP